MATAHRGRLTTEDQGNRGRPEMFGPLSATMKLAGARKSGHLRRRQDAQIIN
jgi:hypothetical protein